MKVKEVMALLQELDPETECYKGLFGGWLTDDLKHTKEITNKEDYDVYELEVEYKTVYQWCIRTQKYITYTGVIFE